MAFLNTIYSYCYLFKTPWIETKFLYDLFRYLASWKMTRRWSGYNNVIFLWGNVIYNTKKWECGDVQICVHAWRFTAINIYSLCGCIYFNRTQVFGGKQFVHPSFFPWPIKMKGKWITRVIGMGQALFCAWNDTKYTFVKVFYSNWLEWCDNHPRRSTCNCCCD